MINELIDLSALDAIDLLDLNRAGPVAAEQALLHGELLYERRPGDRAAAQIIATTMRMDTEWLRRLDLELMSSWTTTGSTPDRWPTG